MINCPPRPRNFAACMAIILAALLGAAHLESVWTARIAASLADQPDTPVQPPKRFNP